MHAAIYQVFPNGWPEQSRSKLHPFTKFDPRETRSANSNNNNSSKKLLKKSMLDQAPTIHLVFTLSFPRRNPDKQTNKHRIIISG